MDFNSNNLAIYSHTQTLISKYQAPNPKHYKTIKLE